MEFFLFYFFDCWCVINGGEVFGGVRGLECLLKLVRNGGDLSGVVMVVGIVFCMLVGLRVFES